MLAHAEIDVDSSFWYQSVCKFWPIMSIMMLLIASVSEHLRPCGQNSSTKKSLWYCPTFHGVKIW